MANKVIEIPVCQAIVAQYVNSKLDVTDGVTIQPSEVYIVWFSKTLHHGKALLSTNLPDGMYYEITYNGLTDEYYFDAYKKFENKSYKKGDVL